VEQQVGNERGKATGKPYQSARVPGERFKVRPRLVVKAPQMGVGHDLEKVLVAGEVSREEPKVKHVLPLVVAPLPVEPRSLREVHLAADQGLDALAYRGRVEVYGTEEVAMVRQRQGGHPELGGPVEEAVYPTGPIEEAVVAVDMQVDEIFVVGGQGENCWGRFGTGKRELSKAYLARKRKTTAGRTAGKSRSRFRLTNAAPPGCIPGFRPHYVRSNMSIEIRIRKNEPIDRALRRMKKKLDRENIIKGTRAKRYYEKPCERRRRKNKVMAFTAMLRRRYDS